MCKDMKGKALKSQLTIVHFFNFSSGDDDPEQDEVDDAFSGKGEKTGTQSRKKTDDDDL